MRLSKEMVQKMFNFIKALPWEVSVNIMAEITADIQKNEEEDKEKAKDEKPLSKAK
jgi:hypothetical protein